ncbi:hypothetical protein GLOIN_2v1837864 [Rhizophagus clarus]|nr:hypothetical protein GLOIN_2v1837864 [Rhizophagus clarus]
MPSILEKNLPTAPIKADERKSLQFLTRPKQIFNKDKTLPIYRKTDTWEKYLKMIQTPDQLNGVVRTMEISPSSSSADLQENGDNNSNTIDNGKISYDNNNSSYNHTLQRESLHLQQNIYDYDDCHLI